MRLGVLATMVFAFLIGLPVASMAGLAPDVDSDGVPDVLDNCLNVSNAGALDCDTDQDGYGNACDCDLQQPGNLACSATDLALWKQGAKNGTPLHADHNCSGGMSATDLAIWKLRAKNAGSPLFQFKSGLSCASGVNGSCPN